MKALRKLLRWVGICTLSLFVFLGEGVQVCSYDSMTVQIPVKCVYMPEFDDYTYNISIEPLDKGSPVPDEDDISVLHDNTGYFKMNASVSGTFRYKIFESRTDDEIIVQDGIIYNIQHDMCVYNITLFVTENDDGMLSYSVTVTTDENGFKTDSVKFKDKIVLDEEFSDDESSDDESSDEESSEDESSDNESSSPVTESSVNSRTSVPPDSDKTTVLTGDTANTGFVVLLFLISLCTCAVIIVFDRKHTKESDNSEDD